MEVLKSNQLSPGPKCAEFERSFAKSHGAKHGLFLNSGTDAIRVGLAALKESRGWKDGDQVMVPALTFVSTVNVILQMNLVPEFVDVGMYDYNFNPWYAERILLGGRYDRLKAILPVHLFGQSCDMVAIGKIAKKHKLAILEDSCETMGVSKISGDIACYSTYVCHLISTGVGGLAITNDSNLSLLMRSYANHGRNVGYLPGTKKAKDITKRFVFDRQGYSARATEVEAVLGLEQLKRLPQSLKQRRAIATLFSSELSDAYFHLPDDVTESHAFMMYPIVIKENAGFGKWELCKFLEKNGIETREMLPLINQPCYKSLKINESHFPVAAYVNKCGFYIGCHPGMSEDDVWHVIDTFRRFLEKKA